MSKIIKYFSIVIIAFMLFSWISFGLNLMSQSSKYDEYIKKGDELFKKEIYIDAIDSYKAALDEKDTDPDIWIKYANSYYELEDTNSYETILNEAIQILPQEEKLYITLANYYVEQFDYENFFKTLYSATDVNNHKKIDELISKYRSSYKAVGKTYNNVADWHEGYLVVQTNDKFGLVNQNGEIQFECIYDYMGSYSEEESVIPVNLDNKSYYINIDGYKKLVADKSFDYLGTFNSQLAPVKIKGKCGWVNREFAESQFEFDYTSVFYDDIAVAKKGNKWALINDDIETITDFKYDDIKLDDTGTVGNSSAIFVKENNKYILVDKKGKQIGKQSFEDARAFLGEQYAAIKQNGKWGFINTDGEIVIKCQYDDAKSFRNDVAGVRIGDEWGLIDQSSKILIEPQFTDVKSMNSKGICIVKINDIWQCIQIFAYAENG